MTDETTRQPQANPPPPTGPAPAPGTAPDWGAGQQPPNWGAPGGGQAGWDAGGLPPSPGPATKFCHACGQSIDVRAEICPKCGVRQPHLPGMAGGGLTAGDATTRTGKSKLVAALLAIFLGSFGVHKFYLGDKGLGVLYLVFFWAVIPGIIGFIEGILWLVQDDRQWLARYGDR